MEAGDDDEYKEKKEQGTEKKYALLHDRKLPFVVDM
jgi:hypothetical protein